MFLCPIRLRAWLPPSIWQPDYRVLDSDLKMSLTRLGKEELLINHAVYRQPVKGIFPLPAYRQEI